MLNVNEVSIQFGGRVLFKDVSIAFQKNQCYGIIGANGAGKSVFLRLLSGQLEPTSGSITVGHNERVSVLSQDQNAFDSFKVVDAVVMGNKELIELAKRRDELYSKEDFSEEDGIEAGNVEARFAELGGYESESDARILLSGLGIKSDRQDLNMFELDAKEKVKVLLAQALFGNPDVLILDEPTNNLDPVASNWLENYLDDYANTVIVVSHDRHFLNRVCTRILDVDYGKITLFVGNYDFWYQMNQLIQRQMKNENQKKEQKMKELEEFIARFSANASKSKQATSRKKELEKIELSDIVPSSRRYPFIDFKPERPLGNDVLDIENLTKNGLFKKLNLNVRRDDKIVIICENSLVPTALFEVLVGEQEADEGKFKWGTTVTPTYLAQNNHAFFEGHEENLIDWLRPYSSDQHESYLRGWLGRMLFSGDEVFKSVKVLSGGEKVRMMFARAMLTAGNVLMLDDPTNHLDLEAITALNNGMSNYTGAMLFTSHDRELIQSVANRILYIKEDGYIDRRMSYDDFVEQYLNK